MHAVVVRVTINEMEKAEEDLQSRTGYWTRLGNEGLGMVVFESEDFARQMADRVPQIVSDFVTLENVEVREVVASA